MKKLSDKEEKPNPYADLDQKQIYERLNILDSKTGGVLSVSSTVIAISLIPATINELNGVEETLMVLSTVCFAFTSFVALSVLSVNWTPTPKTLTCRTLYYRIMIILTAIGLLLVVLLIGVSLDTLGMGNQLKSLL